jgi:hypothetical protein
MVFNDVEDLWAWVSMTGAGQALKCMAHDECELVGYTAVIGLHQQSNLAIINDCVSAAKLSLSHVARHAWIPSERNSRAHHLKKLEPTYGHNKVKQQTAVQPCLIASDSNGTNVTAQPS